MATDVSVRVRIKKAKDGKFHCGIVGHGFIEYWPGVENVVREFEDIVKAAIPKETANERETGEKEVLG